MKNLRLFAFLFAAAAMVTFSSCNKDDDDDVTVIDFESIELPEEGYINNKSLTLEGVTFYNNFNEQYSSWNGCSYSKLTDKETPGLGNQFSVYGDGGANKSQQFAVVNGYDKLDHFKFGDGQTKTFRNVMVTNNTYAVLSMQNGDSFAKKFEAGDWFKVIFTGYDAAGEETGKVEFYLADFRDGKTYICTTWTEVNLESLGRVNKITVAFESTDNGQYGMNTPAYVCMDNLTYWNE